MNSVLAQELRINMDILSQPKVFNIDQFIVSIGNWRKKENCYDFKKCFFNKNNISSPKNI